MGILVEWKMTGHRAGQGAPEKGHTSAEMRQMETWSGEHLKGKYLRDEELAYCHVIE
jgi:hypothetical protein